MPYQPHVGGWMALCNACKIRGYMEMAKQVAKKFIELEHDNLVNYALLLNIYAIVGNKHFCENIEWQKKEKGVKKYLGYTWIEVNNEVHMFVINYQDHPKMIGIHA